MASDQPSPRRVMTAQALAQCLESNLLRPDAGRLAVEKLCVEARELGFYAVYVNGSRVIQAQHILEDSAVKVGSVVGFPLGAMDSDAKRYEAEVAIDNGAQEIDVVLNAGWFKDGNDAAVLRELRDVVEAADERIVKVVLDLGMLDRKEVLRACQLILDSGAQCVKTYSAQGGAVTVEEVKLLREAVGPKFEVEAAGDIREASVALALLEAGANRLGSSSASVLYRDYKGG